VTDEVVLPAPPPPEIKVHLWGGPRDGQVLRANAAGDFELLRLFDDAGRPVAEPYLHREHEGVHWGIDATLPAVQRLIKQVIAETDPDPAVLAGRFRARHGDDARLFVAPCQPGEHVWTDWRTTPGRNRIRTCLVCHLTRGDIL
jgi:hypothetical protein